LFTDVLI